MLAKIIVGCFSTIIMFALVGAIVWFGGRGVWRHVMDGEAALRAQPGLLATIAQDKADASASAKTCDARVQGAYKAAAAIARVTAPRARVNGAQPALKANDIRELGFQ